MAAIRGVRPWALLAATAVVFVSVAGTEASRRQHPQFSTDSDVVRVYATVRDKSGRLLTDLRSDEFEVRDRGAQVPLALFSTDVQPIRLAIMVDVTGVAFERATFQQLRDGLSVFVGQLSPEDRATVGWFSHEQIFVGNAPTSDHAELQRQLDREVQIERAHPHLAQVTGAAFGVQLAGRPLWNAIGAAADKLKTERGRKVILVLANGNNTTILQGYPRLGDLKSLFASDEFMVYGVYGFEPRYADVRSDQITGSSEERQTTLRQVTELTGGGFLIAPFDPKKRTLGMRGVDASKAPLSLAFRSQLAGIVEELRHQYTLGFVPTKRDGKVGSIEVRVNRPETDVWARKTYVAPSPLPSAPTRRP